MTSFKARWTVPRQHQRDSKDWSTSRGAACTDHRSDALIYMPHTTKSPADHTPGQAVPWDHWLPRQSPGDNKVGCELLAGLMAVLVTAPELLVKVLEREKSVCLMEACSSDSNRSLPVHVYRVMVWPAATIDLFSGMQRPQKSGRLLLAATGHFISQFCLTMTTALREAGRLVI
ncbi:hypothetical protein RRG08_051663 [Elysia crispata]|uniref:Uncharacterized protein n=1 Tax=Elysia crispata TaxID=231223 RepID=A0AAE1A2W2_9GAST|nr:hypothetical protein RRG08_051663 [Elysia crispata]